MDILKLIALSLLMVGCGGGKTPPAPPAPKPEFPACIVTLSWELPTEYEDGTPLDIADIESMTVYTEAFTADVNPYLLVWQFVLDESATFTATITVNDIESQQSNEAVKECKMKSWTF